VKCFACGSKPLSNIDLVMAIRGCSVREALEWMVNQFPEIDVPRVKIRVTSSRSGVTRQTYVDYTPVRTRKHDETAVDRFCVLEGLVRSPGWHNMPRPAQVLALTLLAIVPGDGDYLVGSYAELMAATGIGNRRTLASALGELQGIGMVERGLVSLDHSVTTHWVSSQLIVRLTAHSQRFAHFLRHGYSTLPNGGSVHRTARATGISVAVLPLRGGVKKAASGARKALGGDRPMAQAGGEERLR